MNVAVSDRPRSITVGHHALKAYWEAYASIGPRHAAMARWVARYGWKVSDSFAHSWLAPELGK